MRLPTFAHLLGGSRTVAARAEEDRRDDPEHPRQRGETDDDYDARVSAERKEDDKRDDEEPEDHEARRATNKARRARAAKRAEGDDPDKDDDTDKDASAKKVEGDDDDGEGDDDSDGDDMKKKGIGSARLRERARCAAIFAHPAAGNNPAMAATLAFGTSLPRSEAIAVLRSGSVTAAAPKVSTLDRRMAAMPTLPVASGANSPSRPGALSPEKAGARMMQVSAAKARGATDAQIAAIERSFAA